MLLSLGLIIDRVLRKIDRGHSRLAEQVDEEVRALQDHLEALEEVKLGGMR